MFLLKKESAITVKSTGGIDGVLESNFIERPYFLKSRNLMTCSVAGKTTKIFEGTKSNRILRCSISGDKQLLVSLFSSGYLIVWESLRNSYQKILVPEGFKLGRKRGSLGISDHGLVWLHSANSNYIYIPESGLVQGHWVALHFNQIQVSTAEAVLSSFSPNEVQLKTENSTDNSITGDSMVFTDDFYRGNILSYLRVDLLVSTREHSQIEVKFLQIDLNQYSKLERTYKAAMDFLTEASETDLIVELDHRGHLAAAAVNSSHSFYCQLLFLNPATGKTVSQAYYKYANLAEMPCKSDGLASFWVDAIAWSPDNSILAVLFHTSYITMFSRVGEALISMVSHTEGRIFREIVFSTDPRKLDKNGKLSLCWGEKLSICDGHTIMKFTIEHSSEDNAGCLDVAEPQDLSICFSHNTNPLPSEFDMGPKSRNLDKVLLLLRNQIAMNPALGLDSLTHWLESVYPPQVHEEISYRQTHFPLSNAMISSNLILQKKMLPIEVYENLVHIENMLDWMLYPDTGYSEWVLSIASKVFNYTVVDQQLLYAWTVLKFLEKWIGFECPKLRVQLGLACLQEYRNPQATYNNTVYYVLGFLLLRRTGNDVSLLRDCLRGRVTIENRNTWDRVGYSEFCNERERVRDIRNSFLGTRTDFEDKNARFCDRLVRKLDTNARNSISLDKLILVAYFLDPTEEYFLSAVEASFLDLKRGKTIQSLLEEIKRRSSVKVSIEMKSRIESGLIYSCLGLFGKVKTVLTREMAFYVLNSTLDHLEASEVAEVTRIMLELFQEDSYSVLSDLAHPMLKPVFQTIGLLLMKHRLEKTIESKLLKQNQDVSPCFTVPVNNEICEIAKEVSGLAIHATISRLQLNSWMVSSISSIPEFDHIVSKYNSYCKEIFALLWYIQVKLAYTATGLPEWGLRLLAFNERNTVSIVKQILPALSLDPMKYHHLIGLYLRMNPDIEELIDNWLVLLKDTENTYSKQFLTQPPYISPWLYDESFYDFCESIKSQTLGYSVKSQKIKLKCEKYLNKYKKKYRIKSRVLLKNGMFQYLKVLNTSAIYATFSKFALLPSPPLPSKFRTNLSFFCSSITPFRHRHSSQLQAAQRTEPFTKSQILSCRLLALCISLLFKKTTKRIFRPTIQFYSATRKKVFPLCFSISSSMSPFTIIRRLK